MVKFITRVDRRWLATNFTGLAVHIRGLLKFYLATVRYAQGYFVHQRREKGRHYIDFAYPGRSYILPDHHPVSNSLQYLS